jgi:predicted transcriptional regulator
MARRHKETTVTETVKQAILDSGATFYRVAIDADVPYATLFRFMRGTRDMNSSTLDKLCKYLGLKLTKQP